LGGEHSPLGDSELLFFGQALILSVLEKQLKCEIGQRLFWGEKMLAIFGLQSPILPYLDSEFRQN
jgi:hypothetical protein